MLAEAVNRLRVRLNVNLTCALLTRESIPLLIHVLDMEVTVSELCPGDD